MKNYLYLAITIVIVGCNSHTSKKSSKTELKTTNLAELNFTKNYEIISKEFKTETYVTVNATNRIMKTNGLPNHKTGIFPNEGNPNTISAQNLTYKFPVNPKFSKESKWAREPGVALNGIKFEPETAERFVCETGEVYKIEAFQELVDIGLDFNRAHVQPTGAYHYHGVPTELIKVLDKGKDIILIGYAKDGFPIYHSKSGKYKPSYQLVKDLRTGDICSYKNPKLTLNESLKDTKPDGTFVSDWEYVNGLGDLDECNGIELNGEYSYFVTNEYPYMSRCLKGEFIEEAPKGPPPGQHPHK